MMNTQPTSVSEAAKSRVSVRKFTDRTLTREEILNVLDVAGRAPSAFNVQPWRVFVVQDPEVKGKLMEAAYGQPQVGAAAAVLVVTSDMEDFMANVAETVHPGMADRLDAVVANVSGTFSGMSVAERAAWGRNQTNIMLGYLLLALKEAGLGSSPMLGFVPDQVRSLLGLADHVEIPALVAIGEPAEEGFPQFRHSTDRWVTFV